MTSTTNNGELMNTVFTTTGPVVSALFGFLLMLPLGVVPQEEVAPRSETELTVLASSIHVDAFSQADARAYQLCERKVEGIKGKVQLAIRHGRIPLTAGSHSLHEPLMVWRNQGVDLKWKPAATVTVSDDGVTYFACENRFQFRRIAVWASAQGEGTQGLNAVEGERPMELINCDSICLADIPPLALPPIIAREAPQTHSSGFVADDFGSPELVCVAERAFLLGASAGVNREYDLFNQLVWIAPIDANCRSFNGSALVAKSITEGSSPRMTAFAQGFAVTVLRPAETNAERLASGSALSVDVLLSLDAVRWERSVALSGRLTALSDYAVASTSESIFIAMRGGAQIQGCLYMKLPGKKGTGVR